MSESSEPFVVRRSFTYSSFSYLALAAMVAFYIWLIYELHRQAGWSAWVVLITLLLPGGILEWSLQPTRFVEEGERLTAVWYWGRRRTWLIRDLTIPGASRRWTLGLPGYITVHRRSGELVFQVGVQLEDFEEFVELIEPGSKQEREPKHDPNSWWNRNILK